MKKKLYCVMLKAKEVDILQSVLEHAIDWQCETDWSKSEKRRMKDVLEAIGRAVAERKQRDKDATWEKLRQVAFQRQRERRARGCESEYALPEDRA